MTEKKKKLPKQTADDIMYGYKLTLENGQVFKMRNSKVRELREFADKRDAAESSDTTLDYVDAARSLVEHYQVNVGETDYEELEVADVAMLLAGIERQSSVDFNLKKNLELP